MIRIYKPTHFGGLWRIVRWVKGDPIRTVSANTLEEAINRWRLGYVDLRPWHTMAIELYHEKRC